MKIPNGDARLVEGYVSSIRAHEVGYNPKQMIGIFVSITVKVPYERRDNITGEVKETFDTYSVPIHYPLGTEVPDIGTEILLAFSPVAVLTKEEETDDVNENV